MTTVALGANCLYGPNLGGHIWVYLNWALGARSAGCDVVWVEGVADRSTEREVAALLGTLRSYLQPFALDEEVVLVPWGERELGTSIASLADDEQRAYDADLFLDLVYDLPARVVERFARTALINIDPGLLESWIAGGHIAVAEHDAWFSIGGRLPDDGRHWRRTRPCVALQEWPVVTAGENAAFTAVTSWYANEWIEENGEPVRNDKRAAFLPFLDLPSGVDAPLELAVDLADDPDDERSMLRSKGWRVADEDRVGTPGAYRNYVQSSLGEFGCAKPSYVRERTGWLSDRSACYLASGKPVVVQDTGPNELLDEAAAVFRFADVEQAAAAVESCMIDYERRCKEARAFAEEYLDARLVVQQVIEDAS